MGFGTAGVVAGFASRFAKAQMSSILIRSTKFTGRTIVTICYTYYAPPI